MLKIVTAFLVAASLFAVGFSPQDKSIVTSTRSLDFVIPSLPTFISLGQLLDKEAPTIKEPEILEDSTRPSLVAYMVSQGLSQDIAEEYTDYVIEASDENLVDPFTVLSVMHVETGGTFKFKNSPNSHGAIGLMQVLKQNVKCNDTNSCVQEVWVGYTEKDLYDPKKNIMLGTKYLKYLQDRFGNDLGITAYNQGEGNVERGTYRTWYFDAVHAVFKSIEGNDYEAKASANY